jgi:hypothetical protein
MEIRALGLHCSMQAPGERMIAPSIRCACIRKSSHHHSIGWFGTAAIAPSTLSKPRKQAFGVGAAASPIPF